MAWDTGPPERIGTWKLVPTNLCQIQYYPILIRRAEYTHPIDLSPPSVLTFRQPWDKYILVSVGLLSFYFGGVKISYHFWTKIENTLRKLLYFVNRDNASSSKCDKIRRSKNIFYDMWIFLILTLIQKYKFSWTTCTVDITVVDGPVLEIVEPCIIRKMVPQQQICWLLCIVLSLCQFSYFLNLLSSTPVLAKNLTNFDPTK